MFMEAAEAHRASGETKPEAASPEFRAQMQAMFKKAG